MSRRMPSLIEELTSRELEVLELIRRGYTNRGIAEALGISLSGAKYHVSEIITKLGVETREEAAAWRPQAQRRWTAFTFVSAMRESFAFPGAPKLAVALGASVVTVGLAAGGYGIFTALQDDSGPTPFVAVEGAATSNPCETLFTYQCVQSEAETFNTLSEAVAVASFQPAVPAYIPQGFEPVSIRHTRPEPHVSAVRSGSFEEGCPGCDPRMSHNDQIGIYYRNTDGQQLAIVQGFPATLFVFDQTAEVDRGIVRLSEDEAYWVRGPFNPEEVITLYWEVGRVGTGWAKLPDGTVLTGSPMSYAISSDGLPLEELVRIAESVSFE